MAARVDNRNMNTSKHINIEAPGPKEQCLFHYKENPEYFFDMLCSGIWPRFCEEDFTWLVGTPFFVAFPVVCFCDIPLEAAADHRDTYGHYAISISKCFAESFDINPMWYLQEKTKIMEHVASQIKKGSRFELDKVDPTWRTLLPFLKPTIGFQNDREKQTSFPLLSVPDIRFLEAFASNLKDQKNPVSFFLCEQIDPGVRKVLENLDARSADPTPLQSLLSEINRLIAGPTIYDRARFNGIELRKETQQLLHSTLRAKICALNRLLLEDAYSTALSPSQPMPRIFEEEMEWRFTPHKLAKQWIPCVTGGFLTEKDHDFSRPYHMKLQPNHIDQIIVPAEDRKKTLNRVGIALSAKVKTWDDLENERVAVHAQIK